MGFALYMTLETMAIISDDALVSGVCDLCRIVPALILTAIANIEFSQPQPSLELHPIARHACLPASPISSYMGTRWHFLEEMSR